MSKLVCIFPEDKTTDFLLPVYEQLQLIPGFEGYRFDTNDPIMKKNLFDKLQQLYSDTFVFFIGHGASNKLYGSVDNNGEKTVLFDKANIELVKKTYFVGVACRSEEFADNHFPNHIGFGDITSDYSEVIAERNLGDSDFMIWASEEDIVVFQKAFTKAIVNAIRLSQCKKLMSLYNMLKLCLNKQIAELLIQKSVSNYRNIADMLFEVLSDLDCHIDNGD